MGVMKTLTINGVRYDVVTPSNKVNIALAASAWENIGNDLYCQTVTIAGITENSQINLTPSLGQLVIFYEKNVTFTTENIDGVVRIYVIGQKPQNDYIIPAEIVEVTM